MKQNLSAIRLALLAQNARTQGGSPELMAAEPIAIVGLGCRFPGGAIDPDRYWRVLRDGVDAIEEIPADRWDVEQYYDPDPAARGRMSTRWGGFVRDVDRFDPVFFGIAPREAASMDPQQRLLLEVAWEALEDAGQTQARLTGSRTGVFVAIYNNDYAQERFADRASIDAYTALGTAHSIAAGRLSFLLDLQGPSLVVDTACSSSLVAVHLACQSLKARDCELAVAGGVSLILSPDAAISLSKWGFMAADGRCKTFDAAADGFVRGEGCGVVVLKRLRDALADGDRVLAVIRGSAVNQDGRSSVLTAPSGPAQARLIRDALRSGMVDPGCVSYVEAHGTGTSLGDPIELEALADVYGAATSEGEACAVGSVKTNIGHLEAAAGIAGLIKTVLSLGHELIPSHLHFHRLNPHVSLDGTRLVVGSESRPWPATDKPRFAGVSSFGFGGTNAHVVVEEAPRLPRQAESTSGSFVLALSARQERALGEQAARARDLLDGHRDDPDYVRDICHTAAVRRTHHEHRLVVAGSCADDLVAGLDAFVRREPAWNVAHGRVSVSGSGHGPVFVFSGQGSQWWGMGRDLLEHEPVFRDALANVDAVFQPVAGWSIIDALQAPREVSRLDETEVAQPAIFGLQVALAALWRSRGVVPAAVVGHSIGEIAAAHVAGVLDLESAARLVCHRGRLMQEATGRGRMAAVEMSATKLSATLDDLGGTVSIAAINGPRATVISGEPSAVESVVEALTERGVASRFLPVTYAFHSTQMEPLAARLLASIEGLKTNAPSVPWISTVSGAASPANGLTPEYWRRNIVDPVRFADAIEHLLNADHRVFLEIGPHPVLAGYIAQCAASHVGSTSVVSSLRRGRADRVSMLAALGALHAAGCGVDWGACFPAGSRLVSLPTYSWQRERFWIEPGANNPNASSQTASAADRPLHGVRLQSPFTTGDVFEYRLSQDHPAFVKDHQIGGLSVFPAMGVVALVLDGVSQVNASDGASVEDLSIREPLYLSDGIRTLQLNVQPDGEGTSFTVAALGDVPGNNGSWTTYATGRVSASSSDRSFSPPLDLAAVQERCGTIVTAAQHYASFTARGLDFGESFRGVRQVWRGDREALAEVALPSAATTDAAAYAVHPCLLDACAQALCEAMPDFGQNDDVAYLPVAIGAVHVSASARNLLHAFGHVVLRNDGPADANTVRGDVHIYGENGTLLARLERLVLRRASTSALVKSASRERDRLYEIEWVRSEPSGASPVTSVAARQGTWLVLADQGGVGAACANRLTSLGDACITVYSRRPADEPDARVLDPGSLDDCRALLAQAVAGSRPSIAGVLNFWNLDVPDGVVADSVELERAWQVGCGSLLHVAQALLTSGLLPLPPVWLFTRGAQAAVTPVVAPLQTAAIGLARSLSIEHPELACECVDLEPGDADLATAALQAMNASGSRECAIRNGERYVSRLVPVRHRPSPASTLPLRLEIHQRGTLDALELRRIERRVPLSGEVEIRVAASGLNFRDVLNALGMYPGDPGPLGSECAGTVVSVGPDVDGFSVGDDVLAVSIGSIGTHAFAPAHLVAKKPAHLSLVDAASIPIAFLTAEYALTHLGGISRGDRVLIHAAAGGVGLAAVQIALRAGAEIFATAGSDEKRQYLRDLGVQHVFNSRSVDFGAAVRTLTAGRGVDLVLNSLTGDFIPESLDALSPGGRFLEIGKTGVWSGEQVVARRPDISYHVIFLGDLFEREPALSRELLQRVVGTIARRECRPLPVRTFPIEQAADAFRFMAQAKHTGKIVLTVGADQTATNESAAIRSDRSYVVTGGLGALGLHVASELAANGARRLVLASRRPPSGDAAASIAALEQRGVSVAVVLSDVSKREDVARLLTVAAAEAPIGGIVHAAGVVDDAAVLQQGHGRFSTVLAPKAAGACHLHVLSADQPLDFFVLFSSAVSVLGSAGQSNYAAANAVLDGIAAYRRGHGLTAVAINWGPWSEGGMAVALSHRDRERIASQGWQALSPAEGRRVFSSLMQHHAAQVAVLPVDWQAYGRQFSGGPPPFLASVVGRTAPRAAADRPSVTIQAALAALPAAQRRDALVAHVCRQVLHVLGLPPSHAPDPHQGLRDMGLDSLMAVELRNRLQADAGRALSATLAFDYPTVDALASHLADLLGVEPAGVTVPAIAPPSDVDAIRALSDADAEALLAAELAAFDEFERGR